MFKKRSLIQHIDRCASLGYETEILPEKLEVNFFVDYDIVSLHNTMIKIVKRYQIEKSKKYNEELNSIQQELLEKNYIYRIRILIDRQEELKSLIRQLNENNYLNSFLAETQEFLNMYLSVKDTIPHIAFGDELQYVIVSDDNERIFAITNYLNVCKKFIPVSIRQRVYMENNCINCKKHIDKYVNGNDTEYCPHCLTEQVSFAITLVKDNDKSEVESVTSTAGDGFLALFNRDNGKGCETFGNEQITLLDNYFISLGKNPGSYYRNLSDELRDARGRPFGTSIAELRRALNACNLKKYQSDTRTIAAIYWSYKFVDYSSLRDSAMNLYTKLQAAYNMVPFKRKSNLGNHWYLVRIYELLGVEVDETDYKIPKSPKSYSIHRESWNFMCQMLSSDPQIRNLLP